MAELPLLAFSAGGDHASDGGGFVVLFIAVVVFAFVAGRTLDRYSSRLLFLSGVEYIAVGALLGPTALNLISTDVLDKVDLFVSTVLGVIGFFAGLGLRRVRLGIEPTLAGLAAAVGVITVVSAAVTATVQLLTDSMMAEVATYATPLAIVGGHIVWLWLSPRGLLIGVTVGAAAGASSGALIDAAIRRFSVSSARADLMRAMAGTSELIAVVCFGIAMAHGRAYEGSGNVELDVLEWVVITVSAGAVTGVLFSVFLGQDEEPIRTTVATVGVIVFSAGIGSALGVSPLFVNLIAGATVALTSPHAGRLARALEPLRFPSTVLTLLLAGMTLQLTSGWYWMLVPIYALLRLGARQVFSPLAVSTFVTKQSLGRGIGSALLAQSALASAIAVAFAQRPNRPLDDPYTAIVTSTILGGMLFTDILALRSMRTYLADVGEVQPQTELESPTEHSA